MLGTLGNKFGSHLHGEVGSAGLTEGDVTREG